jgi:hypothetical protein
LFEGSSGSGLTTLAKFVAFALRRDVNLNVSFDNLKISQVLLGIDSSVEDLVGVFKPFVASGKYGEFSDNFFLYSFILLFINFLLFNIEHQISLLSYAGLMILFYQQLREMMHLLF